MIYIVHWYELNGVIQGVLLKVSSMNGHQAHTSIVDGDGSCLRIPMQSLVRICKSIAVIGLVISVHHVCQTVCCASLDKSERHSSRFPKVLGAVGVSFQCGKGASRQADSITYGHDGIDLSAAGPRAPGYWSAFYRDQIDPARVDQQELIVLLVEWLKRVLLMDSIPPAQGTGNETHEKPIRASPQPTEKLYWLLWT